MEFISRRKKVISEMVETRSTPEMIEDRLKEFNFYSVNDKGKQRIIFNDDDREEITKHYNDIKEKFPNPDIAFVRAVVLSKGEDKKTGQPVVRLGSYYDNADIKLPFTTEKNGLSKVLNGGITYFTVENNPGTDHRDFKLVSGDRIPETEFKPKEKEEIEVDNYKHSHENEMKEKAEPYEEVMKKKERKGLETLLNREEVTNELTKKQKKLIENLKNQGYKFTKPEQGDIYERVRIKSKEFNESINAWKPKKR